LAAEANEFRADEKDGLFVFYIVEYFLPVHGGGFGWVISF
jgi:hypothetical protein